LFVCLLWYFYWPALSAVGEIKEIVLSHALATLWESRVDVVVTRGSVPRAVPASEQQDTPVDVVMTRGSVPCAVPASEQQDTPSPERTLLQLLCDKCFPSGSRLISFQSLSWSKNTRLILV
jgi:hypothetical protein